jgi:hypothetical protein
MTTLPSTPRDRARERGQVIVIFAGGIVLFMLLLAIVVDVSWYWANTLRVQRAADAAALAGAVYLPGSPATANTRATDEAKKNGYTPGGGVTVTPTQDVVNNRQLNVTVSAPVGTFFMRVIGIPSIQATRTSKAEFVLPVPMGSPENYYGVFGTLRGATFTSSAADSGWLPVTATKGTNTWTTPTGANAPAPAPNTNPNAGSDNVYATTTASGTGTRQAWGNVGLSFPAGTEVQGIEVGIEASKTGTRTTCTLNVDLSWNNGTTYTTVAGAGLKTTSPALTTTDPADPYYVVGGGADLWGRTAWTTTELSDANFRVRVYNVTGGTCGTVRIDRIHVRVDYSVMTTTNNLLQGPGSACANGVANCYKPDGAALNPRGFWATMNTRGASNVDGDAHQPFYDTAGSTAAPACPAGDSRSCYDPQQYYNYGVEMPPGSTGGYVYVFDPGFCATVNSKGTGDRWFSGTNAVGSWYRLLDTNNTPYNLDDDGTVLSVSSGSLFANMQASDTTMGGSGGSQCRQRATPYNDGRDYHNSWFLLNPGNPLSGGATGTVYRLHTTGTDPNDLLGSGQKNTNGEQSFALYVSATGGSPRLYGLGSMQAFTPLCAGGGTCPVASTTTSSEFYLAQIDGVHVGKTVEIQLWDPGDTSPLAANLQILVPNAGGWSPTTFSWRAKVGTTNTNVNSACNTNTGTNTSVTTSTGASLGVFNGCWLTITATVPTGYAACGTVGNPQECQEGWWKIRYNMNGTGTSNDVTTWKVSIRGNPVHLKVP